MSCQFLRNLFVEDFLHGQGDDDFVAALEKILAIKAEVYHVRSVLPDGDAAARHLYHTKLPSTA